LLNLKAIAAVGMSDNTLKIWDWSSSDTFLLSLNWAPSSSYIHSQVKFLLNGLLVAPFNSTASNVYNITTGQVKFSLTGSLYAAEEMMNGNLLTSSTDQFFRIWNATSGRLLFQKNTGSLHYVLKQTNVANLIASACVDNKVYIWDTSTLTQVKTLTGLPDSAYSLDVTASGLLLGGCASLGKAIYLWNITTGNSLSSLTFSDSITCMKLVSDNQLVVGFAKNYIQFINISSSNSLSLAFQVSLVTNSQVNDMRLTMENILVLIQADGLVFFMNLNTTTPNFVQAFMPFSSSVTPYNLDLIG
jgi:WD40 repeat protein